MASASTPDAPSSSSSSFVAVLLLAGIGDRLKPFTETTHKSLAEVDGRTLFARHLDILSTIPQISKVVCVLGYRDDQIRAATEAWRKETGKSLEVEFIMNSEFTKASSLTVLAAADVLLGSDSVLMDGDLLYPRQLFMRLLESPHPDCVLVDESCAAEGEEEIICITKGRCRRIDRAFKIPKEEMESYDTTGEGVGFFKLSKSSAPEFLRILREDIDTENDRFELGLSKFMETQDCFYEPVADLPWTEIDFPEDLEDARTKIYPKILELQAAASAAGGTGK